VTQRINEYVTCKEILEQINNQYDRMLDPIEDHAMVFEHQNYGEKILDEFECPI